MPRINICIWSDDMWMIDEQQPGPIGIHLRLCQTCINQRLPTISGGKPRARKNIKSN
jgi:hypothetical protein